jgi:AcrR family transcriptional regulator
MLRLEAKAVSERSNRDGILSAAASEFARKGFAGARVHAIAAEAGVNIALLYYYFDTKEELYTAVLEQLFADWAERVTNALQQEGSSKQKLIAYLEAYFDFVAESPHRPRLVQQEMSQSGTAATRCVTELATRYVRPVHRILLEILEKGAHQGEFRQVSRDFVYTISATVVSYFTSSAFIQAVTGHDPLTPAKVAERRSSVIDTISSALFAGPEGKKINHKEGQKI